MWARSAGECYQTFIDDGDPDTWTMSHYQFRRYKNGAVFFARKGSGYNSGDYRPIVCVDFTLTGGRHISLSGAALDAALRFDLGRIIGVGNPSEGSAILFQRGQLTFKDESQKARRENVQKRPGELAVDHVSTTQGLRDSIKVRGLYTDVVFSEPKTMDHEIPGVAANVAFRYAWRKAEDTGRFTLSSDALGALKPFDKNTPSAMALGDGGLSATQFRMQRGSLMDASMGGYEGTDITHRISIVRPEGAQDPAADSRPARAECVEIIRYNERTQRSYVAKRWQCTGL